MVSSPPNPPLTSRKPGFPVTVTTSGELAARVTVSEASVPATVRWSSPSVPEIPSAMSLTLAFTLV